jgi:hypothetical protein
MLNALLSGVGSFGGAHKFGHMSGDDHVLALRLFGNRKVGVAGDHAVNLDEVRPHLLDLQDRFSPFVGIADRNRTGLAEGVRSIDEDARREYARADGRPRRNLRAPLFDRRKRRKHVAHAGDAVGDEERKDKLLVPLVNMHVPQAGD